MTNPVNTRLVCSALLPLALLSGCAMDSGRPGTETRPAGSGAPIQVFANPSNPLASKTCPASNPTCAIQVGRTTERPVELPDKTWNCKITVSDVVLVPQPVKRLDWELPANKGGALAFRFTEPKGDNGVWTYADTSALFSRERLSDTQFRFALRSDFKGGVGYAYGIRIEWQETPAGPWLPCAPLDPIIVSLD